MKQSLIIRKMQQDPQLEAFVAPGASIRVAAFSFLIEFFNFLDRFIKILGHKIIPIEHEPNMTLLDLIFSNIVLRELQDPQRFFSWSKAVDLHLFWIGISNESFKIIGLRLFPFAKNIIRFHGLLRHSFRIQLHMDASFFDRIL